RVGERAPPGVMAIALLEQPEGVHKPRIHQVLESLALLLGKALAAAIGLRVGQIELGMGDIEIAAEDHRLGLLEAPAVGEKGRVPVLVPQQQTAQVILRVGGVNRHDVEAGKLGRDQPSFRRAVALKLVSEAVSARELAWKAVDDGLGLASAEDGGAGVALPRGGIPVLMIARQIELDLPPLR